MTWTSMPSAASRRASQKPSCPASNATVTRDLVTFLLGFLPPAAQQLQQCVLIDRNLLQRLALNTRNNASDEPTRLAHLDHRDHRRVHIQRVQTPAEIVHGLGFAFRHRGAPSAHGQCSDG